VEHFAELKKDLPDHISNNLSDKVIRGYYSSSYPLNNLTSFSVKSYLDWIESFDEGLIEMTYILSKMVATEEVNLCLLLYKEFICQEISIRQDLFDVKKPEDWSFNRIQDYAKLLTKLKYLCDEFEGTILYGTDVYSRLSTMENRDEFNEELINVLLPNDKITLLITEDDNQNLSKVFEEIRIAYDRTIEKLDSIREANNDE